MKIFLALKKNLARSFSEENLLKHTFINNSSNKLYLLFPKSLIPHSTNGTFCPDCTIYHTTNYKYCSVEK